jgi:hypothetical protein
MKSFSKWIVLPLLAASVFAQTKPKSAGKAAPKQPAATLADVQALKDALAAQQQQIEQLRQQLTQRDQAVSDAQKQAAAAQQAANDASAKAAALEGVAADKGSVDRLNSDLTDVKSTMQNELLSSQDEQKRVTALENAFGRFRWNGDVRIRGENFNQQGAADRNRARIRVRFGFEGKLNEDFTAGVALATGSLGDPTTTNETFTNNFDRKTIGLDKAYITYNPSRFRPLQLTGGKFAPTWQKTSVTFDPDLNPEGFVEKLNFDLPKMAFVKNVNIQSMQLMYNEVSGTGGLYKGRDSYAIGGQFAARLSFGIWSMTPSYTILNWRYADAILNSSAFAVGATSAGLNGNPTLATPTPPVGPIGVPGEGPGCSNPALNNPGGAILNVPTTNGCVFAPNGMTNSTWTDLTNPTKPINHFLSGFLYSDLILNNQFKTPYARLPINLLLEYEDNLNASSHPFDFTSRSGCTNVAGVVTCTTGQPPTAQNLASQSHAYLIDVSVGQQKVKNDVQVGYAWLRDEQDAAIASFAESDQRAPTNILQHRFYALWRVKSNTTASFTWWHGRTLNPNLLNATLTGVTPGSGQNEHWLNRLQFDLIYTF